MESISLEDDKLEKRLSLLKKSAEESTDSKISRLRTQVSRLMQGSSASLTAR